MAQLQLPQTLKDPVSIERDGRALSMRLLGATSAPAAIKGNVARYDDVAPGVSALWAVGGDGIKEDLVLAGSQAQSSFSYELKVDGDLRPVARRDGGIDVVDRTGDAVFAFAAPFATDANGLVAPSDAAEFSLLKTGDSWKLSVALDPQWLKAPGRAFP